MCRVEFAVWVHRWVEFVAIGLGWIRRGWVGYSPWFLLAVLGLYSPGWAGSVAVVLDSPRFGGIHHGWVWYLPWLGWIGHVGLDLSPSDWIRRRWARFAVVGHNSSSLGTIRRRWVAFALAALNSPVLAPLAEIGCVGFAIVDPTCRRWVQSIAVGLVGCDCDRFSLARAEELGEIEGKR